MQTKISSKGQVVLPSPIRRKLGLHVGESLHAAIEDGRIVLSRVAPKRGESRIGIDTVTRLPVLRMSTKGAKLTSRQVAELLAEFP